MVQFSDRQVQFLGNVEGSDALSMERAEDAGQQAAAFACGVVLRVLGCLFEVSEGAATAPGPAQAEFVCSVCQGPCGDASGGVDLQDPFGAGVVGHVREDPAAGHQEGSGESAGPVLLLAPVRCGGVGVKDEASQCAGGTATVQMSALPRPQEDERCCVVLRGLGVEPGERSGFRAVRWEGEDAHAVCFEEMHQVRNGTVCQVPVRADGVSGLFRGQARQPEGFVVGQLECSQGCPNVPKRRSSARKMK